jgi:eukaryotic-like serine/threonine-protein kinase
LGVFLKQGFVIERMISHYRILRKLGAGGMGEVYLAEDTKLHRRVAFKLLPPTTTSDQQANKRLLHEARAAATLDHPNICTVYEVGEAEGHSFIAMQYVEGATLADQLRRGALTWRDALDIAVQIADALAEAHAHGVIHRDIKPGNIMLTPRGQVKMLDFGLAKVVHTPQGVISEAETEELLSRSGVIMGTAPYMSPEQLRGEVVDARTDIFSFGVVLYEMLTGRQPFLRKSGAETASALLTEEPTALPTYAPETPVEFQRIVRKCLEKDRERRYQMMRDVATDLRNLQREHEVLARSTAPTLVNTPSVYASPRSPSRWILAAVTLLLLSAVGVGLYRWLVDKPAGAVTSLAVLPFANASGDPNTEYLSDGLTESLIDRLSQLPNLRVMSRSSVFRYKGQEVGAQQAARALNVEAVLMGRVTQHGDDLIVNVELVDARDNSRLWGAQYNRRLTDILTVQQDITREISESLHLKLTGEEQRQITRRFSENPEAYQLYLRGRYFWNKRTEEGLRRSIEYYEQAIRSDPDYALAYVGISDSYGMTTSTASTFPPGEAALKAKEAALRALEIDDTLAEAHAALARVKMNFEWDWPAAERELRRAIELNPNYAEAHHLYAHYLMAMKRTAEAFAESQRYLELDPLSLPANYHLGWHYLYARQYDEALAQLRNTAELDPNFVGTLLYFGWVYEQKRMYAEAIATFQRSVELSTSPLMLASLGHAYAIAGRRDEAQRILVQLDDLSKQRYVSAYDRAAIYVGLSESEQALAWLERAYEERSQFMVYLDTDPRFDSLRTNLRFQDLLRRLRFPSQGD